MMSTHTDAAAILVLHQIVTLAVVVVQIGAVGISLCTTDDNER